MALSLVSLVAEVALVALVAEPAEHQQDVKTRRWLDYSQSRRGHRE